MSTIGKTLGNFEIRSMIGKGESTFVRRCRMKRLCMMAGLLAFLTTSIALPCTIISGKTKNNVVWAGNNEDNFGLVTYYLNILPPEENLLGAVSFTRDTPDGILLGGFNEAGLFIDTNSIPYIPESEQKDWGKRDLYPAGSSAFKKHILQRCRTVEDVVKMVNQYIMPSNDLQHHLADKNGTLAVINASGIRIARKSYQVSTNFNILTRGPSDEEPQCWRYPIADKMFQEREVSLDTIRDILDATQQPRFTNTHYSNVINLTTGDAYNYYAGDFKNAYHFNLKELMKKGKKSYLYRSLFPEAPMVKIWETYLAKGAHAAVEAFRKTKDSIPEQRQSEILRHVFSSCIFYEDEYADAKVFFDEWLKVNDVKDKMTHLYHGLIQLTNGDAEQAKHYFSEQVKVDEADGLTYRRYMSAKVLLDRLEGKTKQDATTRFELKGYSDAKFVCVDHIGVTFVQNFLLKNEKGWAADFALSKGQHNYAFLVDGKWVEDPDNPNNVKVVK